MRRKGSFLWCGAVALLVATLFARGGRGDSPRVVEIRAKRFEFTPKEIHLTKGETAVLRLTSEDVTHGFFLRPLKVDTDVPPGKVTEVTVTPDKAGRFTAICNHFCGSGHGNMKLTVIVEDGAGAAGAN